MVAGAIWLGLCVGAGIASARLPHNQAATHRAVARPRVTSIVSLTDRPSSDTVVAGQTVTFTLEIANDNGSTLANVRTCDRLPSRLIFLSATPAPRLSVGRYCWTVARLANGKTRTYKLTAQAPLGAGGRATNTATATADAASVTRTTTRIEITSRAPVACPASSRHGPTAHAAC